MPASVQVQNLPSELMPAPGVSMSETAVTDGVAVSLPALNSATQKALIVLQGCSGRYRLDGSAPTTTSGIPLYEDQGMLVSRETYAAFRVIAGAGLSGTVLVQQFVYTTAATLRAAGLSTDLETVTFDRVRDYLLNRLGQLDAGTLNWSAPKKANLAAAVEDWLQAGWEEELWPRLCPTEERDTAEGAGGELIVPFSGAGLVNIAHVQTVTKEDPRLAQNARPIPYYVTPEGLALRTTDALETVFVRYRLSAPKLTWDEAYDDATAYSAGDVVYWPETGRCYMALSSTTGHTPADTAYWEEQKIPRFLSRYVQYGALAEMIQDDGQDEDRVERQRARAAEELDRVKVVEIEQVGVQERAAFNPSR